MPRVTFEGRRCPIREGESVLDALTRGGANVPFSCRRGRCHVCLLRANDGDPGNDSRRGLRAAMRERGYFLPCVARPTADLVVERPDTSELFVRARLCERVQLSPRITRLSLEPEVNLSWRAGQFVNVRRPDDGAIRSYSIASVQEDDYYLELHVERIEGGALSPWLVDELPIDGEVEIQGPVGACYHDRDHLDAELLLVGTSTGLAPLLGIARDALRSGHRGAIQLHHGARDLDGLYHAELLDQLATRHPNFHVTRCASRASAPGIERARVTESAFARHADLRHSVVYLCGSPEMVHDARVRAIRAGAARSAIHADAFEPAVPFTPDDAAKLRLIAPDLELWRALREGPGLSEILHDFYARVFDDPRLAPFFVHATKQRAIEKQYAFLADVFSGSHEYFGLRPFNAHHWMIISDELFDHREAMFEDCLRRYGLAEHLIRRWSALHETFRREIVKASARGLILDGVEQPVDGFGEEMLAVGSMCDGCQAEMPSGTRGRYHVRTGHLYCDACAARAVGASVLPPPAGP
jgi:ferredoxin-NADP reductase/ferredoxin/truncated hemoglobin YjbI